MVRVVRWATGGVGKAAIMRAEEFSDTRSYDAPEVLRWVMGVGGTPEQARGSATLRVARG